MVKDLKKQRPGSESATAMTSIVQVPLSSVVTPPGPKPQVVQSLHSGLSEKDLRKKAKLHGPIAKQEALKCLAKAIFTEEMISCPVTRKRTGKSGDTPHPPLDSGRMSLLKSVLAEVEPGIQQRWMTEDLQSIQKVLRAKQKSKKL